MANPRSIAMAKIREREALARQAAMLNSGSNTTPVANPIQYSNAGMYEGVTSDDVGMTLPKRNRKGAMLSQITGALQGIVSDDDNDLDDVNFSLADGLKVSLKNNRGKDKNPKVRYSDLGQYEGVTSDDLAGFQMGEDQMAMQDVQALPDAKDDAKRFSALNSFIEENSAGPKPAPEGSHYMPDGTLMSDADMGQYNQSGQSMDGNNSLEIGSESTPIPEQAPLDQIVSEYDQQLLGEQVSGQYAGDKGIDLGYAGDGNRGIELDPLDYQGSEGRYDGVTSDDLASTPEQFAAENPEFEALDQVVSDFELANPELVAQHDAELETKRILEEEKYIEDFALENPELAEHLLENPEMVNELEDGQALYDGLLKLSDEGNSVANEQPLDGSNEEEIGQTLEQQFEEEVLVEEQDTKEAYIQLSNTSPESIVEADKIIDGNDDDKTKEFKLANLFGSLKDIFGVDNKSLLRAFVKYVGGRAFGLSSGKAAQFAWAGIEADMATNAAAGADAKAFQANMDEYDKQYNAAMEEGKKTGNYDEANRILQKMNSLSGVEKSDAEKFDDNLSYLNKKYNEAKKAKDTRKMSQIDKQLKSLEAQGFDGTTSEPWFGTLSMTDPNGIKVVKQAKQTPDGLMYLNNEGVWRFPRDDGYKNANRTTNSDESTEKFATDKRTNLSKEEIGTWYTDIPNAISVSAGGVPEFKETSGEVQKAAGFSLTAVNSYMQMEDILSHSDAVRQEIFSLQSAFRESIGNQSSESAMKGALNKFIKRDMSPAAKLWFNNMNTLVTSKLRRETGAAYNKEELLNTMNFFPNATDYPANFAELDKRGQTEALELLNGRMLASKDWILKNASGLKSYKYLEGLMNNIYRPDDSWLAVNKSNMTFLDSRYNPVVSSSTAALIPTT